MRKAALSFLALVSGFAYAQDDVTVAGRILDAASGMPVPFATVTVLRDGAAVGGELADEQGRFVIEGLERGSYTVSIGFVGYVSAEQPLLIGERNEHYDLGDLDARTRRGRDRRSHRDRAAAGSRGEPRSPRVRLRRATSRERRAPCSTRCGVYPA